MFILNNIKNIPNIPTTIYQFGKIKEFKQENLRTLFSQEISLFNPSFPGLPLLKCHQHSWECWLEMGDVWILCSLCSDKEYHYHIPTIPSIKFTLLWLPQSYKLFIQPGWTVHVLSIIINSPNRIFASFSIQYFTVVVVLETSTRTLGEVRVRNFTTIW